MKILVPVDGSKYSMEALKVALDFAKTKKADVVPLVAGMDLEVSAHSLNNINAEFKKAGEAALAKASEKLKADGVTAKTILGTSSNVAEEIINIVEKEKADTVIIGSRGLTGATRFMLGSTASKVVRHCPCSVYVVKIA
jgi:nucleotide-binding universal stress UspA family protein